MMSNLERNWDAVRRGLLIIGRLRQGPASRGELMAAVGDVLPDAYTEANPKAQQRMFERDLDNARQRYRLDYMRAGSCTLLANLLPWEGRSRPRPATNTIKESIGCSSTILKI